MSGSVRLVPRFLLLCALLCVIPAAVPETASAQPAFLVKDIHTAPLFYPPAFWPEFAQANGLLFFSTDDGIHGREMWRSDGTEAGTFLLADACPGICTDDPFFLTALGDSVYFVVGGRLWKSDGSRAGTLPVPLGLGVSGLAEVNGKLILSASNFGASGPEVWASDGTAAGTVGLAEIWPGTQGSFPVFLGKAGSNLFFHAADPVHGRALWKTDGTAAGTVLVKDVAGASSDFFDGSFSLPQEVLPGAGNRLFFPVQTAGGRALWVTDGTAAGTLRVNNLPAASGWTDVRGLTARSGDVVFQATVANHQELWKTDGTAAGTVQLKNSGVVIQVSGTADLAALGQTVFFVALDNSGPKLWKTDGTPAGTVPVGSGYNLDSTRLNPLMPVGAELLFYAYDAAHGQELWKSDGTDAGTAWLADINPGPSGSFGFPRRDRGLVVDGRWLFGADDGTSWGLWASDGTAAGTQLVRRMPGQRSSIGTYADHFPSGDFPGSLFFFGASEDQTAAKMWKSDGTAAGTTALQPATYGYRFTSLGSRTLFITTAVADPIPSPSTLWRTDGTTGGTFQIPGAPEAPDEIVRAGAQAFFTAAGAGLWKTDGTGAAVQVDDAAIEPGTLRPFGNRVLYTTDPSSLWISDGTPAGTRLVVGTEAYQGATGMAGAGDRFFFLAGPSGRDLWVGAAAAASAHPVAGLPPGFTAYPSVQPVILHGDLVFVASDGVSGFELWRSDGTAAGTVRLADIHSGPLSAEIADLKAGRDKAWLTADDGVHGRELWVTDGTTAGTHLTRDIVPGSGSSNPRADNSLYTPSLQPVGHLLLFSALDEAHGLELWRSDGTAAGTWLLQDIAPGPEPSSPRSFAVTDSYVFFTANDNTTGFEPWAIPRAALGSALAATKTVAGEGAEGATVTYTITIENIGAGPSTDNPGGEMVDVLPSSLTLLDAAADVGTVTSPAANAVVWDGGLPAGGTAVVTIHAQVNSGAFPGVLFNQASLAFDADGNGTNESTGLSDGPGPGLPTPLQVASGPLDFYTLPPCRLLDTRDSSPLSSQVPRTIDVPGACGIPPTARSVAANVTAIGPTGPGHVMLYPAGTGSFGTSTLNFSIDSRTRANNAILSLKNGAFDAEAVVSGNGSVHLVIDVSGYFQ
jgi:uncharacterized repeat protein (TIGR01451 family)